MIKKLAKKITSLLGKAKRKNVKSGQDVFINSLIDKISNDVNEVAKAVDEAVTNVSGAAAKEAKKVAKVVETKVPTKPKADKPKTSAADSGAPKKKGRPKKTAE